MDVVLHDGGDVPVLLEGQAGSEHDEVRQSGHQVATGPDDRQCTRCNRWASKQTMLAKKVIFQEIGRNGRQIRSRITDHLCPHCVAADPDWNQPRWAGSPGLRDANVTVL